MNEWTTTPAEPSPPRVTHRATIAGLEVTVESGGAYSPTVMVHGQVDGLSATHIKVSGLADLDEAKQYAEGAAGTLAAAGWTAR